MKKTLFAIALFVTAAAIQNKNCFDKNGCESKITIAAFETEAADDWKEAMLEEMKLMVDPATGKLPDRIREQELEQARQIYEEQLMHPQSLVSAVNYTFKGPSNMGGRTREIVFDVADPTGNTIIAGSVSGGVYRSTDGGASWTRVNPSNELFTVTAIAQDTRPGFRHIWYYAGGENTGNSASENGAFYAGHGIYKSTDNGVTWSRLANSNNGNQFLFDRRTDFISRLAVNPVNGDVYAAAIGQILRSQDAGANWSAVISSTGFTNSNQYTDVALTSGGRIYVTFSGTTNMGDNSINGVWTSATGNSGSFTRIAGSGTTTSPATWDSYGSYGRVVLAIAPSDETKVYVLYDNANVSSCSTPLKEGSLFLWNQTSSTWTDLSANIPDETGCLLGNDPFSVQGGYDLAVAVKPNDPNTVFIGGTNVYRSTNGGLNWTRIGGYASSSSYARYTNHHSDIHVLKFSPVNNSIIFSGDDGGIQKADITATPVSWTSLNNDYRTYQYYHVAIKQESASEIFSGGTQDNGTVFSTSAATSMSRAGSGDGVAVGLANGTSPYKMYFGYQNGSIFRKNDSQAEDFIEVSLKPSGFSSIFVTYFYLDPDNTENLYYAASNGSNKLLRITNASTATSTSWETFSFNFNGYIRAMATTRGAYTAASKLYIGTDNAKVYRINNPANTDVTTTTPVDITPAAITAGSTVIGIAVNPNDDNEVMIVCSNYNTIGVFRTSNAASATPTWTNVEGNLTLPSYRSCMIVNVGGIPEYYVGTSVGLFRAATLNGSATVWTQEASNEIGNSVVTGLALRPADNTFAIGTHGIGMWKGTLAAVPVKLLSFDGQLISKHAQLNWVTSQEQNNYGFEIERSYDGNQFKKVGFVKGKGESSTITNYLFNDADIALENNYYRLKQLDINGNTTYSRTILLRLKDISTNEIVMLQNPFTNYIAFKTIKPLQQAMVQLFDMNGKLIFRKSYPAGQSVFNIYGGSLPKGEYLLTIFDGSKRMSKKLLH